MRQLENPTLPRAGSKAAPSASIAGAVLVLVTAVVGCSLYANMSSLVTNPANYRFFPPFERGINQNDNDHLGAEYYSIAGALVEGRGYADPFKTPTGPTAWMAPVLTWILAGLRWMAGNDKDVVTALFVLLQDVTLIGTGVLLVALARKTSGGVGLATVVFVLGLIFYFRLSFQHTHDCWLVLASLDLVVAGLVWLRPLDSWRRAVCWGVLGGLCALTSPIVGFTWGILTLGGAWTRSISARPRWRFGLVKSAGIPVLVAIVTVSPWVIRNYLVFGRFIPVKSNLAYELYQSQCLTRDGVLRGFEGHPYGSDGPERRACKELGEMEYLDRKWKLFADAVAAHPANFVKRVANRFLAATVVYSPFNPVAERFRHPWRFWLCRVLYPLPFLCLVFLLATTPWRPLAPAQWIVIGVYLLYLLPYVAISFYDRYKFPLIIAEAALVAWGIDRVRQFVTLGFAEEVPVLGMGAVVVADVDNGTDHPDGAVSVPESRSVSGGVL